jgi:hypothetical protein
MSGSARLHFLNLFLNTPIPRMDGALERFAKPAKGEIPGSCGK